jgi:hypothetical protein
MNRFEIEKNKGGLFSDLSGFFCNAISEKIRPKNKSTCILKGQQPYDKRRNN